MPLIYMKDSFGLVLNVKKGLKMVKKIFYQKVLENHLINIIKIIIIIILILLERKKIQELKLLYLILLKQEHLVLKLKLMLL